MRAASAPCLAPSRRLLPGDHAWASAENESSFLIMMGPRPASTAGMHCELILRTPLDDVGLTLDVARAKAASTLRVGALQTAGRGRRESPWRRALFWTITDPGWRW